MEVDTTTGRLEMRYPVIIEHGEQNFSAYVPDLPGCVSTGQTLEETQRNIQEAIELHLAGMREDGVPIPPPSAVAFAEVA
jgi:predicted RNase H-like HicB family nuclease